MHPLPTTEVAQLQLLHEIGSYNYDEQQAVESSRVTSNWPYPATNDKESYRTGINSSVNLIFYFKSP